MSIIYEPKGRALEYSLLSLNHYVGCSHDCSYCYARGIVTKMGKDFLKPYARPNLLAMLEKDCAVHQNANKRVLLSFLSDPYQELDRTERLTREVIKMLKRYNIPFQVLTKGFHAEMDFDLYNRMTDAFAVTMTSINPFVSQEPNAAKPARRIDLLKIAHDEGIETWVSLEPVLWPARSLQVIEETAGYVDVYKVGKLNHDPALESQIDWTDFVTEAVTILNRLGKKYYIKKDLAEYMPEELKCLIHNTETRLIQ